MPQVHEPRPLRRRAQRRLLRGLPGDDVSVGHPVLRAGEDRAVGLDETGVSRVWWGAGYPLLWECNGSKLARRAHRKGGRGGRAALCARAPRTQDPLIPGLGGWSARWTRAVKASPATRPPREYGGWCAGYPLLSF